MRLVVWFECCPEPMLSNSIQSTNARSRISIHYRETFEYPALSIHHFTETIWNSRLLFYFCLIFILWTTITGLVPLSVLRSTVFCSYFFITFEFAATTKAFVGRTLFVHATEKNLLNISKLTAMNVMLYIFCCV